MAASAPQDAQVQGEQHEQEVEEKEAYQYWGYLFKPDKTGTDKLKGLLSGLKDVMNEHYEQSDCPDLTPKQLAAFYKELHGNYDQLFLETPSESIAFIYKSLGCLHSLQPQEPKEANGQSTNFADPTVPALKTEGWIMWQTIQLLLGPEEHSSFLMEAVQRWDIKDASTGEMYPKILPRRCFPMEPDKHMVAWYEGVSERLRREAEEEERQREMEAHRADVRRIQDRKRDPDEEGSVDSRAPAMAYFNNPLYRHSDGRPSIVRRNSKRPALQQRPTMMGKGKEAASSMGHVIRNIGSPHLWDGRTQNKSHSRDRDRERRRRSLPENRYNGETTPTSGGYENKFSPRDHHHKHVHHQQPVIEMERPSTSSTDDTWNSPDEDRSANSPRNNRQHLDPELRHSRSHEPTPSQKEYGDYFAGYDDPSRRNSGYSNSNSSPNGGGIGQGFAPSASPLFASHVARQPQPPPRQFPSNPDQHAGGPPRKSSSMRRPQGRPYSQSRSPERDHRRHHHHSSSRSGSRRRHDRPPYDDEPPRSHPQPGFPPLGGRGPPRDPRDMPGPMPAGGYPVPGGIPPRDRRRGSGAASGYGGPGNSRMSGSDLSAYSAAEDQNGPRPPSARQKQARFASGVDGRVYPDQDGGRW